MHLIGVRMFQRCAAIIVGVAFVLDDQAVVMVVVVMNCVVVRMMMPVTCGGFGLSPFRRGVPGVVVMHMLAAKTHSRRDHARDWSHDQRDYQNEDREPAHAVTIVEDCRRAN